MCVFFFYKIVFCVCFTQTAKVGETIKLVGKSKLKSGTNGNSSVTTTRRTPGKEKEIDPTRYQEQSSTKIVLMLNYTDVDCFFHFLAGNVGPHKKSSENRK